jgi:hypothetical protein
MKNRVEISYDGSPSNASVKIDGQNITRMVSGVDISIRPDRLTEVTLDLRSIEQALILDNAQLIFRGRPLSPEFITAFKRECARLDRREHPRK